MQQIFNQPYEEIFAIYSVPENVKIALTELKGELAFYLNFIRDYEKLDFRIVKLRADKMKLSEETVIKFFKISQNKAFEILEEGQYV